MDGDLYGYYTNPTLHDGHIVFICETDLWSISDQGGLARRLTDHHVEPSSPLLSSDGAWVAFQSREEGASEVHVMSATGGRAQRLTYQSAPCTVAGWSKDSTRVLYSSECEFPFGRCPRLWSVDREGGPPQLQPLGPVDRISYGPLGGVVIGRNVGNPAHWKRYRGGRTGELWVDAEGHGAFSRLAAPPGNLADPMWIGARIYFVSDHEGWGNIYSCTPFGHDLRRHTSHADFYARNASTDGRRIVYQAGAELYLLDPAGAGPRRLDVRVASTKPQLARRFVQADHYVSGVDPHPKGHSLALVSRGQLFTFGNWERAVTTHGERTGVRYRLATHLQDGKRLACISDAGGEEAIEIHDLKPPVTGAPAITRLDRLDIGRAISLVASPTRNEVVLTNHRLQLLWIDVDAGTSKVLDESEHHRIQDPAFSPDGRWVAYSFSGTWRTAHLRLAHLPEGEIHDLTEPVHDDRSPSFDPTGRYLFFLSDRTFNPVYDRMYFDLHFPLGGKVYFLTLQRDTPSPLRPGPRALDGTEAADPRTAAPANDPSGKTETGSNGSEAKQAPKDKKDDLVEAARKETKVDLPGISGRVLALPVAEAIYGRVEAISGKVLYNRSPSRTTAIVPDDEEPRGTLVCFDLEKQQEETFATGVGHFTVAADRKTLIFWKRNRLRVVKADAKPADNGDQPGRNTGFIDLGRLRVPVVPAAEWRQMYREAWRLQRDHFWNAAMSGVDWNEVYRRYLPVLQRVATRREFSDLLWEMQGELGTSHAYESAGDYPRRTPYYGVGRLGADLSLVGGRWIIAGILRGDSWSPQVDSPLAAPGLDIQPGDCILRIDSRPLDERTTPGELLESLSETDVDIVVQRADDPPREVTVRPLRSELALRYRAFVETNRKRVHALSDGRLGYLHIPDMGPHGYAEFHRYYRHEIHRTGLVVDVRYNRGGNVSQLLLEKLTRKRIGYKVPRHGRPYPYPLDSVLGPIVCVTNEHAGSDGDIFSHNFKLMKLGPLVGKRTWGGTIGIRPLHRLVDHTRTTQAEFASWFEDVGFGLENRGTEPDVDVDITPQDWAAGRDAQLDRAVAIALESLEATQPALPDFGDPPNLKPPRLKEP